MAAMTPKQIMWELIGHVVPCPACGKPPEHEICLYEETHTGVAHAIYVVTMKPPWAFVRCRCQHRSDGRYARFIAIEGDSPEDALRWAKYFWNETYGRS